MKSSEEVVKVAAGNKKSGKEVMTLVLDARNWRRGKEIMMLLIDRRGTEIRITEKVVKAAAREGKEEVVMLWLDRRSTPSPARVVPPVCVCPYIRMVYSRLVQMQPEVGLAGPNALVLGVCRVLVVPCLPAGAVQVSVVLRWCRCSSGSRRGWISRQGRRRCWRSVVLGKAKVISFEDIEVARAARAAKEVIKGKGKRGRKRKSAAQEADEPEPEPEPELARMIEAPEQWRAPVARMY
jgi:hypothetical protein